MSAELQLRDYLDNSTEASKRIRTILTILVVVTVLVLAGFLNTWHGYAWNRQRIRFQSDYVKQLHERVDQLTKAKQDLTSGANDLSQLKTNLPPLLTIATLSPYFGSEECEKLPEKGATKEENESALREQIKCYEGAIKLSQSLLDETIKAYVVNVYFIRVPFFGVAFDINDLGAIGGLSLIVILIMLRLNLRNFIVSLRIGFKAARDAKQMEQFYDVLAGRQLFAFPDLEDSKQDPYEGRTEAIWNKSRVKGRYESIANALSTGFFKVKNALWAILKIVLRSTYKDAHEDPKPVESQTTALTESNGSKKTGWYSNRHPLLALVPTWICLVPAVVYGAVVVNDFMSYEVGMVVNKFRTISSFAFSLICLVAIFGLGCWCVSKWIEIDQLWKVFSGPVKARTLQAQQAEVLASDGKNGNAKPVAPVASTT